MLLTRKLNLSNVSSILIYLHSLQLKSNLVLKEMKLNRKARPHVHHLESHPEVNWQ